VQQLSGFPISQIGPIAALVLLTATLGIAIFGAGSIVGTVMTAGSAAQAVPIPVLSATAVVMLVLLILAMAAWRYRRDTVVR